jgi:hypothetical protein
MVVTVMTLKKKMQLKRLIVIFITKNLKIKGDWLKRGKIGSNNSLTRLKELTLNQGGKVLKELAI